MQIVGAMQHKSFFSTINNNNNNLKFKLFLIYFLTYLLSFLYIHSRFKRPVLSTHLNYMGSLSTNVSYKFRMLQI